jgi:hypothetical protein
MGSEEHAREIVGEIDLNGDGVVSYEEFKAMMQGLNNHSARYRALMGESEHPDSELAQEAGTIHLPLSFPLSAPLISPVSLFTDAKLAVGDSSEKKKASKGFFNRSKK